jgi:hypothetical protein
MLDSNHILINYKSCRVMGFFKSQFWQASWIWQQVSVCVCVQLILLHLLLLFITCLVICLYLRCVVCFSPNPSISPSPFLVQLSSKLLLCDVWEWWVWFFPWRLWFLSFWCFLDFFVNNFWISPYNCWSKYEHSFGRLRDSFYIQTSPSVNQMELYSIWVVHGLKSVEIKNLCLVWIPFCKLCTSQLCCRWYPCLQTLFSKLADDLCWLLIYVREPWNI